MIQPETLFRLLSDGTRLRSVLLLHKEGRLCVCELSHALALSQPKISRHLAQLRTAGLLVDERRGQWVHYQLASDLPDWVLEIIGACAQSEESAGPWITRDRQRLAGMSGRPNLNG